MTDNTKQLEAVMLSFMTKSDFQKGLLVGFMMNQDSLEKALMKVKEVDKESNNK